MRVPLALALLSAVGCRHEGGDFDVSVEATDADNVWWVRWETSSPGTSWVEYGTPDELYATTVRSTEAGTVHEVLLAGLPAGRTAAWRAFTEVDGEVLQSALQETETAAPPPDLPAWEPGSRDHAGLAWPGFALVSTLAYGDVPSTVVAFDRWGEPAWWYEGLDDDEVIAQARLSADGASVLYNLAAEDRALDVGRIVRVRLDGVVLSETTTPMGHHDFVELPDGTLAYLAGDVGEAEIDGTTWSVVGDAVREIDEGGTEHREVWSSWDSDLAMDVDPETDDDFYEQGLDWTHANNVVYDADTDTYLVSVRNLDCLVKVDRQTGETLWQLGGEGSDFTQTAGRAFVEQHSPELTEDGLLLFDDGQLGVEGAYSMAVEFEVDEEARTFGEVWRYDNGQRDLTYLMGDADRLPNGNTLISWGNLGRLTEVTPDGTVAWQVDLGLGNPLGFSHHLDALGGAP